jgi:hypothetical protein
VEEIGTLYGKEGKERKIRKGTEKKKKRGKNQGREKKESGTREG